MFSCANGIGIGSIHYYNALSSCSRDINVVDMLNKSREDVAYNEIDIQTEPSEDLLEEILAIDGVINVRVFEG